MSMFEVAGPEHGGPRPAGHRPLEQGTRPDRDQNVESTAPGSPTRDSVDAGSILHLQQTAGNAAVASMLRPSPGDLVRKVVGSPGEALDARTSAFIQSATGKDPSHVRLHTGPEAGEANRAVGASKFASGNAIVSEHGLDVSTPAGQYEALHEFEHAEQQKKGEVEGTVTPDGLKISDPSDRHEIEADEAARRGMDRHAERSS